MPSNSTILSAWLCVANAIRPDTWACIDSAYQNPSTRPPWNTRNAAIQATTN